MAAFRLTLLDETTSTNDEVKLAIEAGAPEGFAVRALRQTAGYGRQGRSWASPEGGLYLSLLLRPNVSSVQLPTLSLAVGLAVQRALAGLCSPAHAGAVQVKWPNDVVLCESPSAAALSYRKLCGISLEQHAGGVCVGIGVNVCPPSDPVQVGGKNVPAYMMELGMPVDDGSAPAIDAVATAVLDAFDPVYRTWCMQGFGALVDEYNRCCALTGQRVAIANHAGTELVRGTVLCAEPDGRLAVQTPEGECVSVSSGEAHMLIG